MARGRPGRKKVNLGDEVYAKWPGSSMFYKGSAVMIDAIKDEILVKFDDDNSLMLSAVDVYLAATFQKRRSRSRSKSPSRKRSRSPSPSRKGRSKSPTRKSPTRRGRLGREPKPDSQEIEADKIEIMDAKVQLTQVETKDETVAEQKTVEAEFTEKVVEKVVEAASDISEVETNKNSKNIVAESVSEVQSTISEETEQVNHTEKLETKVEEVNHVEKTVVTRRVTRSMARTENIDLLQQKDEASSEPQAPKPVCDKPSFFKSLLNCSYNWIEALMMLVAGPAFVYGLHFACKSSKHCTFLAYPKISPASWFFHWKSTAYVFGWFGLQILFSLLPLGKIVDGPVLPDKSRKKFRLSGAFLLILNVLVFSWMYRTGRLPIKFFYAKYTSMITATVLFTFLISNMVYIKTKFLDTAASSGKGFLQDYVLGTSVYPTLLSKIDVKMFAMRTGLIAWLILDATALLKHMNESKTVYPNASLMLLVAFHFLYGCDMLLFEETLLYTWTLTSNKVGFMFLSMLFTATPFYFSMQARYLNLYPLPVQHWSLYLGVILFNMTGYYIYRKSNMEKFLFRKDPHSSKMAGVDYIATEDPNKGILVDGWWGFVRHPNYLGDFMMALSWGVVCGFNHFLPWLYPVALLPQLITMAIQDDARCLKKYGAAWEEYQKRVKYRMVPGVF